MTSNPPARPPVIDFHAHVLVPDVYAVAAEHNIFSELPTDPGVTEAMRGRIEFGRAGLVLSRISDLSDRIATMDAMGVDIQVLTASLVHQVSNGPTRRRACGSRALPTIRSPLRSAHIRPVDRAWHAAAALQSLAVVRTRALHARAWVRGVDFSRRLAGWSSAIHNLDRFRPKAEELGTVIYIHPGGNRDGGSAIPSLEQRGTGIRGGDGDRVADLRGRAGSSPGSKSASRTAAVDALLHGTDRPQLYREGQHARQHVQAADRISANAVLRLLRLRRAVLQHLVDKVGADRVVLGSDYPVGEMKPVEFMRETETLSTRRRTGSCGPMRRRCSAWRISGAAGRDGCAAETVNANDLQGRNMMNERLFNPISTRELERRWTAARRLWRSARSMRSSCRTTTTGSAAMSDGSPTPR